MRWPWSKACTDAEDARLIEAQRHAEDLEARGSQIAEELAARLRRNHWSQTVAEIVERGAANRKPSR